MNRKETLDLANAAVGQRHENYGTPRQNFERIAMLWNAHLVNTVPVVRFDATDVALMLLLVKVARLEHDPKHLDSWVDVAGYAACGAEVSLG